MIRKPKRPGVLEKPSADSSEDYNVELDELDDIIELDDVIEPHGHDLEDNDKLSPDEDILDEETGLGFGDLESKIESEDEFVLDGDLFKGLPFFEDQTAEPESRQEQDLGREESEELARGLLSEIDEGTPAEAESERKPLEPEETKPEVFAPPGGPPVETSDSLDELVAQIESRLVDAVREIVESRLPEIVRTVLKEEIERLKNDHEPEA
jgi:hypothetical protein